jgi:hypothetical protein
METKTKLERQYLACGYEPPADGRVRLTIWQPPDKFYGGPELTTCAGYTANLPEVIEVVKARRHWKVGALSHVTDGETASDELMDLILIADAAFSGIEQWMMTPARDGGGGAA